MSLTCGIGRGFRGRTCSFREGDEAGGRAEEVEVPVVVLEFFFVVAWITFFVSD